MSTNYYHHETPRCVSCGRLDEGRHIGKSSVGWCFSLHVYPEDGIHDLPDWEARWGTGEIRDEYGEIVPPREMSATVRDRHQWRPDDVKCPPGNASWVDFHARNHSEPGPRGLFRHQIGQYCRGHGEGTWDLITGDFL